MPVAVSPPRSVFDAVSGLPPRPNRIGSGFWLCSASSTISRLRLFAACIAIAGAPGATTEVGCTSRSPNDITTWPKRPSWKCSVTYSVCGIRTSIPSKRSRYVADGTGRVTSVVATEPVPQTVTCVAETCVWSWKSDALPLTVTRSPRPTLFASPLKTKMPSEVAGSPSPVAAWR